MKKFVFILIIGIVMVNCQTEVESPRYPILLNMVHHNPGEPLFLTQYTQPDYLKELGYSGQITKNHVQCGLTYDAFEKDIVPQNSEARLWIERHAASVRLLINNAEKCNMPLYPFTDVLVIPRTIMDKYGEEMKIDGHLSILRERTQEILRAQVNEIFERFPKLAGLTIRHGETYLHDTPFHVGGTPARTPEEHALMINILRDEVCVKRDKKLFYRTWDFNFFHTNPDFYLKATNAVEPHPNLYFSIKHVNYDFVRGYPFNTTIGIGKHQQIIEVSTNQAGLYGRNAFPYYIGKGIIEGWSEMKDKKGIQDLLKDEKIKGFWTWTWGDGWVGPYFDNELWVNLNEYVLRSHALNPKLTEEELFNQYANEKLKLSPEDIKKLRELCLLSTDAVHYGQASKYFFADPWWCRDHFLTAINLDEVVAKGIKVEVLKEKKDNIQIWYEMERLAYQINIHNPDDREFLQVSTTYGRIKYEIIEQIWRIQIMMAELDAGKPINKLEATEALRLYAKKWQEWQQLKSNHPCCPTLYLDYTKKHGDLPPFQTSVNKLNEWLNN